MWAAVSTNTTVRLIVAKDGSVRHPDDFGPLKRSPKVWKTKLGVDRYVQQFNGYLAAIPLEDL